MKTMINNKNVDMELFRQLKGINFEYLVQLSALIAENVETNGADCLEEEMQVFDTTLDNVIKERMDELINAEKQVKELLSDNELDIEFENEARELVISLTEVFDGKSISADVLDCSNRVADSILEFKSFKSCIEVMKTTALCIKDNTLDIEVLEDLMFKNYLAIWNVLHMIDEQDWTNIDDFEILVEEDILVKDYLLDYINSNVENGLETDADLVEFLCSCGLDNNIYVRTLEDENGCVCLVLFDDNENRLSDCYYLN
ncbi:hypothetical protein FC758_01250 [Clostridium botulinum]|nr:hypothetical protein [Clostridium botulinum]